MKPIIIRLIIGYFKSVITVKQFIYKSIVSQFLGLIESHSVVKENTIKRFNRLIITGLDDIQKGCAHRCLSGLEFVEDISSQVLLEE